MNQQLHPGHHPDADQMNTFVEGAASAREREQLLAHLAECDACREMVFLLRSGEETQAVAVEPAERAWRRWFMPLGFAGAALACGIAGLVYFRPHGPTPERAQEMATVQTPNPKSETGQSTSQAAPAPDGELRPPEVRRAPKAVAKPEALAGGAAGGAFAMKRAAPAAANATQAPRPVPAGGPMPRATASATIATAGVAAGNNAQQVAGSAFANESLSPATRGRSISNLTMYGRLPSLRIEHDRGPDDGLSEINGRVTDVTGAVILGATLVLRDAAGTTREVTTDAEGKFSLTGVEAGDYDLSVTARGFESMRQAISLKPRDLAMLDSVLKVGSASQTVTVVAESNVLQTSQAEVSAVQAEIAPKLPSRLPVTARVVGGKRVLSMDAAGTLFLSRNGGRSWKKVKPVWVGNVAQIALADKAESSGADGFDLKRKAGPAGAATASSGFQITLDSGAVWVSADGTHWRVR